MTPAEGIPEWTPGSAGKGLLIAGDETVEQTFLCWAIEEDGSPHHADAALALGVFERMEESEFLPFVIEPSGEVATFYDDSPLEDALGAEVAKREGLSLEGEGWSFS